jgi:predicted ribosome quality control (RQC) complex YloA/Tae2 family protein
MDAVSIDHILAELRPLLLGRHLSRPRLAGPFAVTFELSSDRERRLWLDAARGTAGVFLVTRESVRRLTRGAEAEITGRARQALLHLRKHLDGARVSSLARVAGERTVVLEAGGCALLLRLAGAAPALTLARDGTALATLGEGPQVWPPPPALPEREWSAVLPEAFEAAVHSARAEGRTLLRAALASCPGLGPLLARETDGSAASFAALRSRLREARPTLLAPAPPASWRDADLARADAVTLAPILLERPGCMVLRPVSWLEAGALLLEARLRGRAFGRQRSMALEASRRRLRRLEQLEANLEKDLAGLADEHRLRREAEALLAFGRPLEAGSGTAAVPDPYEPERRLTIALDPRLSGLANAERRFEKARRAERARQQVQLRLRETRSLLRAERTREAHLLDVSDVHDLAALAREEEPSPEGGGGLVPGPRHYLTTKGLSFLVGRTARENHHLTFRVARPEDLWLHARDFPGAHVVLRDNEGRAGAEDLREAAEAAAFFSEARTEPLVDVQVTRRKHVRPARGGAGRVLVAHSDTLRVVPRSPQGRLRRR